MSRNCLALIVTMTISPALGFGLGFGPASLAAFVLDPPNEGRYLDHDGNPVPGPQTAEESIARQKVVDEELARKITAERLEGTYRNLDGFIQFDYLSRMVFFEEDGREVEILKPVSGSVVMGKDLLRSEFFQEGRRVRGFSLAPDGKMEDWSREDGLKESTPPFPHGTDGPNPKDADCLCSGYYSFVGVPAWDNLGLKQGLVTKRLLAEIESGTRRVRADKVFDENDVAHCYSSTDKITDWMDIILHGERNLEAEKLSRDQGSPRFVYRKVEGPNRWNEIWIEPTTHVVTQANSRKPTSMTWRYFSNIYFTRTMPDSFDWKIKVGPKPKQEATKSEIHGSSLVK